MIKQTALRDVARACILWVAKAKPRPLGVVLYNTVRAMIHRMGAQANRIATGEGYTMRANLFGVLAIAIGLAVYAPMATAQREGAVYSGDGGLTISIGNSLALSLDAANGAGVRLSVGGSSMELGMTPLIRFEEVLDDPSAPDLLEGQSWGMPEEATEADPAGDGGPWLRVSGEDNLRPKQMVKLEQNEAAPLILSGWCRADLEALALGWWNRHLALNANGVYADGRHMPERSAFFGQYDHGPQFNRVVLCPDAPLDQVDLDLSVPNGAGTAWYRGVELRAGQYRRYAPDTPPEPIGNAVHQTFHDEDAKLSGLITYLPRRDTLEIQCRWQSLTAEDRALSVYVSIPIDAVGGVWRDHFRGRRIIEAGQVYRDSLWYGAGRDGYNSRYPLGCVETADGLGLALAIPPDAPRLHQIEYDAGTRVFRLRIDVGMSPDAGPWANRGDFTAYLFPYDTRDGFRGATEQYHQLFAWAFRNDVERQGIWLPFITPDAVAGDWASLGFQFVEAVCNVGWEDRQGLYTLRYAEPWIHHHELTPGVDAPEIHGPPLPEASIALTERIAKRDDLPLDIRRRYPAYKGAYVADPWGQPDGYFFRGPEGGRNENMMIVNHNELLQPPTDAPFSLGGWDRQLIREADAVWRHWHVEGWTAARTASHPFLAIDTTRHTEGGQSLRMDPVEGSSYYEQYLRGIEQVFYLDASVAGTYTLSLDARAVSTTGVPFTARLELIQADGQSTSGTETLEGTGADWRTMTVTAMVEDAPFAAKVSISSPTWTPSDATLWLDNLRLTVQGQSENLLRNGGFEQAELLQGKLDGVYLDTIECYEADLNYRRDHWPYTEEPLVFDSARRPVLHQLYAHAGFVRRLALELEPKGKIIFGNCVPVTPFVAPYLDAMGNELNWKHGDTWQPWPDEKFNHARFMARDKPYCLLQYGDLTVEEQTRYVKRCLFYGMFPSNQAAPGGGWYWKDPVVVARHRPVFERFVPLIQEVAEAGWRPLTFATSDNPAVWLERFGESDTLYLTAFNPGPDTARATITLDPRANVTRRHRLWNLVTKEDVPWGMAPKRTAFKVELGPEDVAVFRFSLVL